MTEPKFTPGPYRAVITDHTCATGEWYSTYTICAEKDGKPVGFAYVLEIKDNGDEAKANAHLLAAAPTMFKALETCRAIAERHELEYMVEYIDFILKKARGEM